MPRLDNDIVPARSRHADANALPMVLPLSQSHPSAFPELGSRKFSLPASFQHTLNATSPRLNHASPEEGICFCSTCGSAPFWDPIHKDWTAIAMGAFDGRTDAKLARHIFVADKGDYYDIADGLPQNQH
jgi:hypothetical protein